METPIIEIKKISKKYNITHMRGGYISLRDVLMNVIKSPFSFLKTKVKRVAGFEKKEEFWALKDISFNVNKGEVVGIIGANGAGKSTLLKILSQITPPTTGEIVLRGRVGSLLEVGTGFHPELTGRENIFLNGAILGMKKKEIAKKFDEIVEFAGIGKFLDTPVKYYSSGMYVRLAFSVAAHMEPDILIVDEVLAVGDAEFQKKCLGKMEEVTQKEGRTILFVSHNMEAIKRICSRTILLKNGQITTDGETNSVIDKYQYDSSLQNIDLEPKNENQDFKIKRISIKNKCVVPWTVYYGQDIHLEVVLENMIDVENFRFGIGINDTSGRRISTINSDNKHLKKGTWNINVHFNNILNPGSYELSLGILGHFHFPNCATLTILDIPRSDDKTRPNFDNGLVTINSVFEIEQELL